MAPQMMAVSLPRSIRSFEPDGALTSSIRYGTVRDMSLIRGLFWLVLFVFFTFCFVVLFESARMILRTDSRRNSSTQRPGWSRRSSLRKRRSSRYSVSRAQLFVEHRGADDQPNACDAGAHPLLRKFL